MLACQRGTREHQHASQHPRRDHSEYGEGPIDVSLSRHVACHYQPSHHQLATVTAVVMRSNSTHLSGAGPVQREYPLLLPPRTGKCTMLLAPNCTSEAGARK
eukprot:scaffold258678_cov28-Tisochrysis_lutea.AAC.1